MLQIAGRDPLRDEGIAYGEALRAAGVTVDMVIYKGLPHGFAGFYDLPEAEQYYRRATEFISKCAL